MADVPKFLKIFKRFKRKEEGQSLTEFALVAPVLIMIAVGILLLGYFLYSQIIVVTSANQGARAGSAISVEEDASQAEMMTRAQSTAESMLSSGLNVDNGSVNSTVAGDSFETTVTYEFQFPVGIPGTDIDTSYTIDHTSTYHIWGDDDDD